jgi:serine/threonine-protein kinase
MAQSPPGAGLADINLLFGILAVQMDFITRDQLVTAMNAWVLDKKKSLGAILVEQKVLGADRQTLLQALVQEHLKQHKGDPQRSLAAVSSMGSVKHDLECIADPNLQASLVHVAAAPVRRAEGGDPYATVAPSSVGTPTSSGLRFRILRPHARGGLGQVFVARDDELHREVALKEIQDRHADHPDSRARFLLEAEITGGLEHPGIVPVYGLGQYGDGRPFYAMRFIRGDSLKEAIERFHKNQGSGDRVLELRQLLGRFVDVCNAIAYAHSRGVLHRDLKPGNIMLGRYGETLVVDWGLAKSLDRPADFGVGEEGTLQPSSLGSSTPTIMGSAVGTPQFMSPEQAAGRLDQLGPASDIYSLGATLYSLLTGQAPFSDDDVGETLSKVQRGDFVPPRQIDRNIQAPLEAVCLKAMARKPEDRYGSAQSLADEIEHWLADEPVSAWKEPWTVRASRWLRRHKTLATGVATAIGISAVALAVATVLLSAANERERQARHDAEQQKEIAERNYQVARQAVDRYHTDVSESVLLHEPGLQPLRKKLLEAAREFYDRLVKDRRQDAGAHIDLGRAYFRLAQITADIESETKAIALHQQALPIFTALNQEQPSQAECWKYLAECHHHLGRLFRLTDQLPRSQESYEKALAAWEHLVSEHPLEEAYQAGQARSQLGLGNLYQVTRNLSKSRQMYEDALAVRAELARNHPERSEYQRDLAVTHSNLAMVITGLGGSDKDAEAGFRAAIALQEKLVHNHPNISQYKNDLARSHFNLADLHAAGGRAKLAASGYQQAVALWKELTSIHPAVQDFRINLAESYSSLASSLGAMKLFTPAETAAQEAIKLKEYLAGKHPDIPTYHNDLARGQLALGDVHRSAGHAAKAVLAYQEALRILDKLANDRPGVPQYQGDQARVFNNLGLAHVDDKQTDKAEHAFLQARTIWEKLHREQPQATEWALGLSRTCANLGNLARLVGNLPTGLECYTKAIEPLEMMRAEKRLSASGQQSLRNAYWKRAELRTQLARHDEALRDWDRTLELSLAPDQAWFRLQRALTLARGGDYSQASAEAEGLLKQNSSNADSLYQLACVYALSASAVKNAKDIPADAKQRADEYALHAVEVLGKLRNLGFFQNRANIERLEQDADWQVVRPREEFQKLLREMGAKGQ